MHGIAPISSSLSSYQIKYVETSAKLNINIHEVFYNLVREIEGIKGELITEMITSAHGK